MVQRIVLVSLALAAAVGAPRAWAQQRQITGRVTNATSGEAVGRANVSVEGTAISALTSDQGEFSLAGPEGNATLLVRHIGFRRREITVSASQGRVEVTLEPDVFKLEAVVVTGLATGVERRNAGNALGAVAAFDRAVEANPYDATAWNDRALALLAAGKDKEARAATPG